MLRRVAHNCASLELDIEAEIQAFRSMLALPQTRTVLSRRGYGDRAQFGFIATRLLFLQGGEVRRVEVV